MLSKIWGGGGANKVHYVKRLCTDQAWNWALRLATKIELYKETEKAILETYQSL